MSEDELLAAITAFRAALPVARFGLPDVLGRAVADDAASIGERLPQ